MNKKNIENEKFIFYFNYNEELKKFENTRYTGKNLNKLENEILKETCLLFNKCRPQELYEHLIIRIENKLRDFNNIVYSGIIFPENIAEEYIYFQNFFRDLLNPYLKDYLNNRINFQTIKPSEDWSNLKDEQKKEKLYNQLIKFGSFADIINKLKIIRIVNKTDIYIELPTINDMNIKNKLCLDIEIYLKRNVDEALNIYLETLTDKNKLRRLTI